MAHPKSTYQPFLSIDSIGSVTFNQSKTLIEITKPLLRLTDQQCKNVKQLGQELKNMSVHRDKILISQDVSVFTKTPAEVTLHIVENRLRQDRTQMHSTDSR